MWTSKLETEKGFDINRLKSIVKTLSVFYRIKIFYILK